MGYTSDLARRSGGSTDPSGERCRRSAVGNSFHLPSVTLLYALLIAPAGAGAFPIDGVLRAPSRIEQFDHVHQHSLGFVLSPEWLALDHLARTSAQVFDEAIAMFPPQVFHPVPHVVSTTRNMFSALSFDCFQNSPAYAEAAGASLTALGVDTQALWSKSPMHAAIGHHHRRDIPAQQQPKLAGMGPGAGVTRCCGPQAPESIR